MTLLDRVRRRPPARFAHPATNEIVKILPSNPPEKRDVVLVDGERCRVVRSKVTWEGRRWTLHGIWVRPEPLR